MQIALILLWLLMGAATLAITWQDNRSPLWFIFVMMCPALFFLLLTLPPLAPPRGDG